MKTIEKCFLLGLIMTILLNLTVFSSKCEDINNKILRLHILANSDTKEDQELKLKVRDVVLNEAADIFKHAKNKTDAIDISKAHLEQIKKIAASEVKRNGYDYKVDVQMVNMYFNTRTYDNVTIPAGNYDALRILIGKSSGHNWWCVMFPAICIPVAEEKQELSDVLTPAEIELTQNKDQYDVQFKFVEYFRSIKDFFYRILCN